MDRALLPDRFAIPFYPSLAVALGGSSNGALRAMLVQQIHYWCSLNKENEKDAKRDGVWWTRHSRSGWYEEFPCFGKNTVDRALDYLRESGVVIAKSFSAAEGDTTLWYRIDYRTLRKVLDECPETAGCKLDDFGLSPRTRGPYQKRADGHYYTEDGYCVL